MTIETIHILDHEIFVYETSGSYFGYPKDFGDCIVTEIDDQVRSIVFSNGVTEVRNYVTTPKGPRIYRTLINENAKTDLVIDVDC